MNNLLRAVVGMLLTVTLTATAQEQRELLVNYIPSSFLKTNNFPVSFLLEPSLRILPQPATMRDWASRCNRFEAEFGLRDKQPNLIEGAKYQMDRVLFVFKDFMEHSVNFDYELNNILRDTTVTGPPRRYHGNPLIPSLDGARLKSDIRINSLNGHSFLGVKLILPIGN